MHIQMHVYAYPSKVVNLFNLWNQALRLLEDQQLNAQNG